MDDNCFLVGSPQASGQHILVRSDVLWISGNLTAACSAPVFGENRPGKEQEGTSFSLARLVLLR